MKNACRLAALVVVFLPRLVSAQTTVPGGTLTTQTWTASGSPYTVTGALTVTAGVTLTVEPGVTVQFASTDAMAAGLYSARVELTIAGTLVADGTPASPISFTGLSATAGSWYGVVLGPTASG